MCLRPRSFTLKLFRVIKYNTETRAVVRESDELEYRKIAMLHDTWLSVMSEDDFDKHHLEIRWTNRSKSKQETTKLS